jgi:hypothetical protein
LKRPLEADEESSGLNKKPKMNTSMGLEPEGDVLVVLMVSAHIQLTFTANSVSPCDLCRKSKRECTGRTRSIACNSCQYLKKACKIGGRSIRAPRSTKPERVANLVIAAKGGSNQNATILARGSEAVDLAREYLELAKKVQGLEGVIESLRNAAMNDNN